MNRATTQSGFTLLEAIVTLVIFSMVVALLMQSLQQALQVRQRVFLHQRITHVEELQSNWFRDSLKAALATASGEGMQFTGTGTVIEFVSQAPLEGRGTARVVWLLKPVSGGDELRYASDGWTEFVVVQGPVQEAAFSYLDGKGNWKTTWKPEPNDPVRLPVAVRLQGKTAAGPLLWIAALPVEKTPATLLLPKGFH